MCELIIIAGPQAAGKSTAISNLNIQFRSAAALFQSRNIPVLMPMQESRQIQVHKNLLLGAIFMEEKDEREIVNCDFKRMQLLLDRDKKDVVYVDECNVFTLAHAKAHGINNAQRYRRKYLELLTELRAKIIFIDVPPNTSWERRRHSYEQRLIYFPQHEHELILVRYREYLERIYPLLHNVYEELPFPKKIINGTVSQKTVSEQVTAALSEMSDYF